MNFNQWFRPISISLSPNTEKDDVLLAFKLLFQPWNWQKGSVEVRLQQEFQRFLGVKYAFSFNSGRSSLMAILSSLDLNQGDEVLLQAFTCNAAANPIIWSDFKPIFVDIDEETFNIDAEDLKRKITSRSRAVMVQHTFGLPADIDEILEICRQNNLILIEDCAHSLGAEYKSKKLALSTEALAKVGTFGKVAFFSFSRDKVISSVYGGMAVTDDDNLAGKIKKYQLEIGYPSNFWTFQQLLHPVLINWLILPTYRLLGKYLLILFQWFQVLSKAVHWKEKRGMKPCYFPKRLPNALAILAQNQFRKLEKFNDHRKEIAEFYSRELTNTKYQILDTLGHSPFGHSPTGEPTGEAKYKEGNIFLRFPVRHPQAHQIIKQAWDNNFLIGDWYDKVIAPHDTQLDKLKYLPGTCPKAEKLAEETFNLPTHINISQKEAQKIVDFLKSYGN